MNLTPRVFQIVDNAQIDARYPFALVDDTHTVVEIGPTVDVLADYAFDDLGADVVEHEGEVVRADSRFQEADE